MCTVYIFDTLLNMNFCDSNKIKMIKSGPEKFLNWTKYLKRLEKKYFYSPQILGTQLQIFVLKTNMNL